MILVIFSFDLLNLLPIRSLHLLHDSYMYTIFLICHFITVERAVFGMLLLSEARGVQRENILLFMPFPKFVKVQYHWFISYINPQNKSVWQNFDVLSTYINYKNPVLSHQTQLLFSVCKCKEEICDYCNCFTIIWLKKSGDK